MIVSLVPPSNKEPVKIARILHFLYEGGSLNRFEAASILHDTCLNSTISGIRNNLGILVAGKTESVKGYKGISTICNRYWLHREQQNIDKVRELLINYFGYEEITIPAA